MSVPCTACDVGSNNVPRQRSLLSHRTSWSSALVGERSAPSWNHDEIIACMHASQLVARSHAQPLGYRVHTSTPRVACERHRPTLCFNQRTRRVRSLQCSCNHSCAINSIHNVSVCVFNPPLILEKEPWGVHLRAATPTPTTVSAVRAGAQCTAAARVATCYCQCTKLACCYAVMLSLSSGLAARKVVQRCKVFVHRLTDSNMWWPDHCLAARKVCTLTVTCGGLCCTCSRALLNITATTSLALSTQRLHLVGRRRDRESLVSCVRCRQLVTCMVWYGMVW